MIREVRSEDAAKLIEIQRKCIAGTGLMVSTVNEPDFFLRSSLYEDTKTFVSIDEDTGSIQGTLSVALKKATLRGQEIVQGYVYQLFTNPSYRRKGIARMLLQHIDQYMEERKVDIATLLILEKNYSSMHLFETEGYYRLRMFANPYLSVYKKMKPKKEKYEMRTMTETDLEPVCSLLNSMWEGKELYVSYTPQTLKKEIERTPDLNYESIYLLWENKKLQACIAVWNWSDITKVTVKKISFQYTLLRNLVKLLGHIMKLPVIPGPGDKLRQACLYFYGFTDVRYFTQLLMHVNNCCLDRKISEICFLCENDDVILHSLKKFVSVNIGSQLYIKKINPNIPDMIEKVWINGADI